MSRLGITLLLLAMVSANARSPADVKNSERAEVQVLSSEEKFMPMNYVMFESDLPSPAKKVSVESRKVGDHLVTLKVRFAGRKPASLPMKILAMFQSPQLETMLVRGPAAVVPETNYWAIVYFSFGNRIEHCNGTLTEPQFSHAEILFPLVGNAIEIVVYDPCHNVLRELTIAPVH